VSAQGDQEELSSAETAEELGMKDATLAGWRRRGIGPAFERRSRTIVYRRSDIEAWRQKQLVPEGRKPKQPFWPRESWWRNNA
jgi:hypothetical protein